MTDLVDLSGNAAWTPLRSARIIVLPHSQVIRSDALSVNSRAPDFDLK